MPNGQLAMAAIGLCVPLTTIINAFNGLLGRGESPLSSIKLGEGNTEDADHILINCFSSLVVVSILITVIVLLLRKQILYVFGASEETIQYALDYVTIYCIGTIFVQLSVGLNYFINSQGFNRFGMVTNLLGAGLNILLDPIFIYYFQMGIKGVALATVIVQGVICVWGVLFFFAFYRKIILLIPLIFILPEMFPSYAVYAIVLAELISDIVTTLTNTIYFNYFFIKKKLPI